MRNIKLLIVLLLLCPLGVPWALGQEIPLNRDIDDRLECREAVRGKIFFTSDKPFMVEELSPILPLDSLLYPKRSGKMTRHLLGRKLFNENLFLLDTEGVRVSLDPVFHFEAGKDEESTWINTRGFTVCGRIGRDVTYGTAFYENQAVFPEYLDDWVSENRVVPGQGPVKTFKDKGFDYAYATGYVSYTPSKYFNFRLGHGKNFIGDGYRSLLLSDASFSYPYLKITTTFWKLRYVNLYAQFTDLKHPWSTSLGYTRKYATFHYLTAELVPRLQLGVFEAVVWEAADSTGNRGFDIQYLNPLIFYRPVEFSLGSPDNALLGFNASYRIFRQYKVYSQVVLDDFNLDHARAGDGWWANKYGFQAGLAGRDVLQIPNLTFRAELNVVRPYTYAHGTSLQCYGHYNQPLAHPMGANFREGLLQVKYSYRFWNLEYRLISAEYGVDTNGSNYGKNIFLSYLSHPKEYDNQVGQGIKTRLMRHDVMLAYLVNPRTNLRVEAGVSLRSEKNVLSERLNTMIWFGIRTALVNLNDDW